ncbi:MAG: hypothetical protein ACPL3B_03510 [Fervidobacterium sp.]
MTYICQICGFKTKHSSVMVKHLRNVHRFTIEQVREKWYEVVSCKKIITFSDEIDVLLSRVRKV